MQLVLHPLLSYIHVVTPLSFRLLYIRFSDMKSSKQPMALPSQLLSSHNAVRSSSGTWETKLSRWSSASGVLCSLESGTPGCSWIFIAGVCNDSTMSLRSYGSPTPTDVCSKSTLSGGNLPGCGSGCTQYRNQNHSLMPLDASWPLACKSPPSLCAPLTFLLRERQEGFPEPLLLVTAGS